MTTPHPNPPSHPTAFSFYIGGITGHSYRVELKADGILYTSWGPWDSGSCDEMVEVHPEDWVRFRAALDTANVWAWQSQYEPTQLICDGTRWNVAITWGDQSVESSGTNAYPTEDGELSEASEASPSFASALRAVVQLIGGRPFA